MSLIPFNPLDSKHLGVSVAKALLAQEARSLGEVGEFEGAGIYALYYTGDNPSYAALAARNQNNTFTSPIYAGKAVPKGSRRGDVISTSQGNVLFHRLKDHAESIRAADNLKIEDFHCRFLVVEDIWITLAESLIIKHFVPFWNCRLDGFGNHNPGKGRHEGKRPLWDVLHPGRPWADKLKDRKETKSELEILAIDYLKNAPEGMSYAC